MATPLRYEIDLEAERMDVMTARAYGGIAVSDLLAVLDDLITQIVEAHDHPAYALADALLHGGTVDAQAFLLGYQALMDVALGALVDEQMVQDFDREETR